jgi:hypothetical protein
MKKLLLLFLSVGLLAANDDAGANKPKPRFPLGKETTYVTEPLDADGYVDFVSALNERWRRGVTPANNANVLLWKALGPHPEEKTMPEEFFKWMKIKPPPEQGEYFVPMYRYLRAQREKDPRFDSKAIEEEASGCSQRLWKASEHPHIASWLKMNEKPLAIVAEATKRTHYYSPLLPNRAKKDDSSLIGALMPGVQQCREMARTLTARAMLRLEEGRIDEAWQDLLTCHRLGRLVAQGEIFIEALVGIAIDAVAAKADLAFLECPRLKSEQIKKCLHDLQKLPPMPSMADKVDFGERFIFLDVVAMLDRDGVEALAGKEQNLLEKFFQRSIDWEPALRKGNRSYDRMAKTMRMKDRQAREKEFDKIEKEMAELDRKAGESKPGMLRLLFAKDSAKIVGEQIGDIMIVLFTPAVRKVQNAADRSEQVQNNLYLAFALAAYQHDHGLYPKELTALVPKYLDKIPMDLFACQPLVYRPNEKGYLLYSVGVNGRDEEGQGSEDDPPGDDLSVRIPLPKLKQK